MYLGFTLSLIIPLVLHIRLYNRQTIDCIPRKLADCTTELKIGLGICLDGPREAMNKINDVFSGIRTIIPHVRSVICQQISVVPCGIKTGVIETVRKICGKTNYHIQGVFVANVGLVAG